MSYKYKRHPIQGWGGVGGGGGGQSAPFFFFMQLDPVHYGGSATASFLQCAVHRLTGHKI